MYITKYMKFSIIILLSLLFNCAYFLREPGRPPKIDGIPVRDSERSVYLQNFRNNTYAADLHTRLTQLLKSEIDKRGRFIQTRDKSLAKYRIYGEVVHYQLVGNLLTNDSTNISNEMTIVVKLDVQKAGGGSLEMERNEIPVRIIYSEQLGYRESENQAQLRALKILSVRIAEECERAWYYSLIKK